MTFYCPHCGESISDFPTYDPREPCPECWAREHLRRRDFGPLCGCLILLACAAATVAGVLWAFGIL